MIRAPRRHWSHRSSGGGGGGTDAPLWAFAPGAPGVGILVGDDLESYTSLTDMGNHAAHPFSRRLVCRPNSWDDMGAPPVNPATGDLITPGLRGSGQAFQIRMAACTYEEGGPQGGGLLQARIDGVSGQPGMVHRIQHDFRLNSAIPLTNLLRQKGLQLFHTAGSSRIQINTEGPTYARSFALPTGARSVFTSLEGGYSNDSAQQPVGPYWDQLFDNALHTAIYEYRQATPNAGTLAVVFATGATTFSVSQAGVITNGSVIKISTFNQIYRVSAFDGSTHCTLTAVDINNAGFSTDISGFIFSSHNDGSSRYWIDDVKVIDVSPATVNVTPPGGAKIWCDPNVQAAIEVDNGLGMDHAAWVDAQTSDSPAWTYDLDNLLWVYSAT